MKWHKKPPKSGWYWVESQESGHKGEMIMAHVDLSEDRVWLLESSLVLIGSIYDMDIDSFPRYYGPVNEPKIK